MRQGGLSRGLGSGGCHMRLHFPSRCHNNTEPPCGVQALLLERKSENQAVNNPSSCQTPSLCLPARILKMHLGILTLVFTEYEILLCIYSLDKLTQLRDNWYILSYNIQNPFLDEVIIRPLKVLKGTASRSQPLPPLDVVGPHFATPIQEVHSTTNYNSSKSKNICWGRWGLQRTTGLCDRL